MEKELELYIKANYAKLEGYTLIAVKDAFEAAWQAQQAKIDELQARIDEVLDYVGDDFTDYYTGVMIESIHKILKGNKDEN